MVKHTFFLPPRIERFSSHCLSQKFHHFMLVLFVDSMATKQKFIVNNTITIKEECSRILSSLMIEIAVLFWDWVKFQRPAVEIRLLVTTSYPLTHVSSPVTMFFKSFHCCSHGKKFLDRLQDASVFAHQSAGVEQIWL